MERRNLSTDQIRRAPFSSGFCLAWCTMVHYNGRSPCIPSGRDTLSYQAIRNRLANKETVRLDGGVATQKYGKARRIRPRVANSVNQRQGFIDASLRAGALGQCAVSSTRRLITRGHRPIQPTHFSPQLGRSFVCPRPTSARPVPGVLSPIRRGMDL